MAVRYLQAFVPASQDYNFDSLLASYGRMGCVLVSKTYSAGPPAGYTLLFTPTPEKKSK